MSQDKTKYVSFGSSDMSTAGARKRGTLMRARRFFLTPGDEREPVHVVTTGTNVDVRIDSHGKVTVKTPTDG